MILYVILRSTYRYHHTPESTCNNDPDLHPFHPRQKILLSVSAVPGRSYKTRAAVDGTRTTLNGLSDLNWAVISV